MRGKDLFLLGTIVFGLAFVVKSLQVVLTPEAWAFLVTAGRALLESSAVGFLLVATAILFLLSLIAVAWDRAERRYDAASARAELAAKGYTVVPDHVDPSSLLDDSPGALPEAWQAPCGEPIRFPSPTTDRGSAA